MSGSKIRGVLPRWEHILQYTANPAFCQRRTFASSLSRHKQGFPTFQPTSSPELDNILSAFRDTIFLPAHLSKEHRQLVYKTKHQKVLETTSVIVDIGGEEIRLKHIDRTKDVPDQKNAIRQILQLMKGKEDWDNFPLLLEGLHSAGRLVSDALLEQFIRAAGRSGRQDIVLESLRRVTKTGFRLNSRSVARYVMWWIQHRALFNDFSPSDTKKALSMAEQIAILMEDEGHAGGRVTDSEDPRASPEVIGILLELSAVNAKHRGGKDEDGSVEKYAKSFLASMQSHELEGLRSVTITDPLRRSISESNSMLQTVVPILYGIRTALLILDQSSETSKQLRVLEPKLAAQVAQDVEILKANPSPEAPLGLWTYEKIEVLE